MVLLIISAGDLTKGDRLLSGLVLNPKSGVERITQAASSSVDLGELPWDNLVKGRVEYIGALAAYKDSGLSKFLATCLGPLGETVKDGLEGRNVMDAMAALGVAVEKPVVVLAPKGTKEAFVKQATRYFLKTRPDLAKNPKRLESELAKEMKLKKIRGYPAGDPYDAQAPAVIDEEHFASMPKGLSDEAKAAWARGSIRTAEEMEAVNLSAWRGRLGAAGEVIGEGMPAATGIVMGLFEFIAMSKMHHELSTSLERDKGMNTARYVAAATLFGGTVIGVVGEGMKLAEKRLAGAGSSLLRFGEGVLRVGAGVGCVAGLAMAVMDFIEASKAYKSQQFGLFAVYLVSGLAGTGASICFALIAFGVEAAWVPVVGWICAGIAFVASISIALLKDNKIQEWMERCTWGTKDRYPNMHDEIHELNLALGV